MKTFAIIIVSAMALLAVTVALFAPPTEDEAAAPATTEAPAPTPAPAPAPTAPAPTEAPTTTTAPAPAPTTEAAPAATPSCWVDGLDFVDDITFTVEFTNVDNFDAAWIDVVFSLDGVRIGDGFAHVENLLPGERVLLVEEYTSVSGDGIDYWSIDCRVADIDESLF